MILVSYYKHYELFYITRYVEKFVNNKFIFIN